MEALGKQIGKTANAIGGGVAAGFAQAANETLGGMGGSLSPTERSLVWIVGIVILCAAVRMFWPSRKNLAAFAKGV